MKQSLRILALLIVLIMALSTVALADKASVGQWAKEQADALDSSARVVNLYTWIEYIPNEIIADFENASGIRVNYTPFDSLEEMYAKLSSVNGLYDIVICNDFWVERLSTDGLLEEIDPAKLPNYANIDPRYMHQNFDPENKFSIPYTNCAPLIAYDPSKIDFAITGWADLWREDFANKLVLLDDPRFNVAITEKMLGYSLNETDPAKLEAVKASLLELKGNVAIFDSNTPNNALSGGDAIAGTMYASNALMALEDVPGLAIVYPEEGVPFFIDNYQIIKSAPHMDATYIFLNYMLDGEIAAAACELIAYDYCNTAADEFASEAFKTNPYIKVPDAVLKNSEIMKELDAATLQIVDEMWTEFKMS